ncbi:hypothetical protein B0H15DRAFT_821301 [Mycena belliarum]|uniref:MYND-type domain-containing protein n=1 Tax=Mycena belliarum TaxID=1033014 RepID=A0AAD6UGR3_9AGAR|nr:hypothetical protein B0H15DRAFT_821301 [Mycena belliae]
MPTISNLKSQYIPGFENPMTSFEISTDDESPEPSEKGSSGSKNPWSNVQFINSAGDGYGPHATTLGDIANKIPAKPSLKKSCEKCRKRPDQEGTGYSVCASCKVARYCSRECQTSHWKEHKRLCQTRVKHAAVERDLEAKALRDKAPFVSQAALRKWYYDNVDIVDYTIIQTLELYKGRGHDLWRTHAVVFMLSGGTKGTSVAASEIKFHDAEAASFTTLARKDRLDLSPVYLSILGSGSRIILIFILNRETDLMAIESHDLPADEEWAKMEKDDMWRMHIRMRNMAQMMG